jgi:hypothetical protein
MSAPIPSDFGGDFGGDFAQTPAPAPPNPLLGQILPIIEARLTFVTVKWNDGAGDVYISIPTADLPQYSFPPGPQMLVGFNLDGSYTLYRPLPYQYQRDGSLAYQPIYGGSVLNALPLPPRGTTG